ncbi:hypothetical protein BKA62DRAFT_780517 [Auriculariales sp. MPI-PUGE-AT-0066]|nr:hypothetical protein BKA62DRAFT_780517 [Auriculariales sp. MPI-PUGE-AT-0066]
MLLNGGMVNEDVVWTASAALQLAFNRNADSIALLDTYAYEQWLEGSPLTTIFRGAKASTFWLARRIILPVYDRDGIHWMAAMVRPSKARIDFYDSFARPHKCEEHGRRVGTLVTALLDHAHAIGIADVPEAPRKWNLVLATSVRVQSNVVDCGLWAIANIAAIIRGYRVTGLQEVEMTRFRQLVHGVICAHIPPDRVPRSE